ncbi:nitroreductase family deazaflavin-dependent oxidoreductase [Candidatus Poriferisodalis sp.]|uniref:nitroreductase family deazaflavin-dependent oxidoreductase n=1 Tax=Candidatus Poriferisodalis sp. TaxID=3101277 RepID=UPI003B51855B
MAHSEKFDGEYGPSTWDWVKEQADAYEASSGKEANTLRDTGLPVIVMTTVGHKTGLVRKVPLMRVEHEGEYAIVGSKGGAPAHPGWYHNLMADPTVLIQDGPEPFETTVRLITGAERDEWWERCVEAFSPYAEYQAKTDREIPVFITARRD